MPDFYPDVYDYQNAMTTKDSVNVEGLEFFVLKVKASTGLSYFTSSEMVRLFFQEIRNSMLDGDIVNLNEFGKFFISKPVTQGFSRAFPKFKAYKELRKRFNEKK